MVQDYKHIVVIHPAAIGDVMFGTPTAALLKSSYPEARLTYWTHPSLFELLKLCQSIDQTIAFDRKQGLFGLRSELKDMKADLIVDLVGSTRTKLITAFQNTPVLTHNKKEFKRRNDLHIVDSILSTLNPLGLNLPAKKYPTLTTDPTSLGTFAPAVDQARSAGKQIIALVPSVGTLRPHRAWRKDGWNALVERILKESHLHPVLVGGKEDIAICESIATLGVETFAGKLSLPETATLLSCCQMTISADTGPAHLSVAVGTPVIGLYGPTLPARNGPYGNDQLVLENCSACQCQASKHCSLTNNGSGKCMDAISADSVWQRLISVLRL